MSTTTERPPAGSGQKKPGSTRPARSKRARYTTLEVGGSVVVALGAAVIANAAFGVSGAIALVVIGYLGFVGVVAFVELSTEGPSRPAPSEIDLVSEERGEPEVEPASQSSALHPVPDELPDEPRRRRSIDLDDIVRTGVAAVAAAGFAEVLRVVLRMHSLVGVAIWWYAAFAVVYYLLARDQEDAETALDRVVTLLVWSAGALVAAVLAWMLVTVVTNGAGQLSWTFLTHDLRTTGPLTRGGGALHSIIGTVEQVGIATAIVVPLGILTAVYLHEIRGRIAGPIRFIVDAMSGLPSIVAGLLIFTAWVIGHGYSGAAGSAALVVLMLPTMTRATEEILRTVPDTLREGALALGAPQWRLVLSVVLPTALAGIVTASLLAIARAIGETAPMLLTAFSSDSVNVNPLHGPQSDLPLFVYKLIFLPNKASIDRAWTGALLLILFVLVLFVSARLVARRGLKKIGGKR